MIARQLASEGVAITIIDIDAELIRRADESHDIRGVVGHASYRDTLREAGAMDADMLIAVTRSDEVNMVACQVAYSLFKVTRRIARLRHVGYTARVAAATTSVRMDIARSGSTPLTPILSNSAVNAANTADGPAQTSHCGMLCISESSLRTSAVKR